MHRWLNVRIEGHAYWPAEETRVKFGGCELLLKPATKGTEQSVHISLKGISEQYALTLINRFLSILSWCDEAPMENLYGFTGSVVPVPIYRDTTRTVGSCIGDYSFNRDVEQNPKACLALALYREALTVNSVPFSFLSFFKILNIFWKDTREQIEGIRETLPELKDEEAIKRINQLRKTENDIAEYLYGSGRCAVAHAYSEPLVDPDDLSQLRRLSDDIRVIRAIAEHLIEKKLNVSRFVWG